ncbi:MAG: peroxiredoxin-like family protein [Parvularculaceae bacterium]
MTVEKSLDDVFAEICGGETTLRERLAAFSAALPNYDWGRPFADVYDALIAKLSASDAGSGAPGVGDRLPNFILPDAEGRLVELENLLGAGPLVVSFNRGHWCQFCEIELRAFAEAHSELAQLGARVISIMPERQAYLRTAKSRTGDAVTYVADVDNGYALQVGLAIWLGDDVSQLYRMQGLDLPRYQGNQAWFAPIPATFVLSEDGHILSRNVDPDFRRRMDVDEIIASLPRDGKPYR